MKKNILGIVGGMGPLATNVLYKYIIENTKAEKDQEHLDLIILSAASMPDRTEAILAGDISPIIDEFRQDLSILEAADVRYCVIPCNTCHVILDDIRKVTDIEIIDMIRLTAGSIRCPGKKVGIMGTSGTRKAGLYHKAIEEAGMIPVELSDEMQELTMHIIYDQVKAGMPFNPADFRKVEEEFLQKGCDRIILACTELSVINDRENLPDIYADPMRILARHVIPLCGGELK